MFFKKVKEHKFVIVRTRIGNYVGCISFMTPHYNCGKSSILPRFVKPDKIADKIELQHFVGGMLSVVLTTTVSNGIGTYDVVESVVFEKGIVTSIEIYTEFNECRSEKKYIK